MDLFLPLRCAPIGAQSLRIGLTACSSVRLDMRRAAEGEGEGEADKRSECRRTRRCKVRRGPRAASLIEFCKRCRFGREEREP